MPLSQALLRQIDALDPTRPVLIAGPTASGKSALALEIAQRQGGAVINADALQVFDDWRVLTARPSAADEARAPHMLYGHIPGTHAYSVGDWLRDLRPLLRDGPRPIITGGTGLYFTALTDGLAEIPAVPSDIRTTADDLLATKGLEAMVADLDPETAAAIDLRNPMRVQRAWEVLRATGRGLRAWQRDTPPPLLPANQCHKFVLDAPKDWLTPRIERRFDLMLQEGALDEARANLDTWHPALPSAKTIGAAELIAHLRGEMTLSEASERATVLTRQFAKRQRTWFKSRMSQWSRLGPHDLDG
ncbi:tRNA (adenosine(37)-N6)-dimethylallyltransferase MiaA [Sagittula sp. SSi028]|uniref:tRNA (adenosine(37)-N6)-dimethylallyltransferase MiaA n=1 Tax=Sagittula sp. SSi028 TaxID=3400636 RepID=UPI003AF6F10D